MSDEVIRRLDCIDKKVSEIKDLQTRHDERLGRFADELVEVRTEVFGNDKPGLKVQMQKVESNCKNQCRIAGGWRRFGGDVAKTVVAAAIIAIIFWMMGVHKTLATDGKTCPVQETTQQPR